MNKRTVVICAGFALTAGAAAMLLWKMNAEVILPDGSALLRPGLMAEVAPEKVKLAHVAASPDGKFLIAGGYGPSYERDDALRMVVLDAKTLQPSGTFAGQVSADLSFLGDGSLVASSAPGHTFCVWELASQRSILSLPLDSMCPIYGVSPDRRWVGFVAPAVVTQPLGAHYGTTVRIWDAVERKEAMSIAVPDKFHRSIAVAPGGKMLAMCESSSQPVGDAVVLYDATGDGAVATELPTLVEPNPKHDNSVRCLKFSPDGTRLYGGRVGGQIEVWDTRTRELLMTWDSQIGGAMTIALSADGTLALSGGGIIVRNPAEYENCDLRVWRTSDGTLLARATGSSQPNGQVAFTGDGKRIVCTSFDRTIRTWDLKPILSRTTVSDAEQRPRAKGYPVAQKPQLQFRASLGSSGAGTVIYNLFTPDGNTALRADHEGNVEIWSTQTWQRTGRLPSCKKPDATSLFGASPVTSADGTVLAVPRIEASKSVARWAGMVDLWALQSGQLLKTIELNGALAGLGLSPDGKLLYGRSTEDETGPLQVITVSDGERGDLFAPATGGVGAFTISRDGALLAVTSRGGLDLVNAADGTIRRRMTTASVHSTRFSDDGSMLVGVDGETVRWWNTSSGELAGSFAVSRQLWASPAISPHGKLLAIPMNPHLILVDTANGKVYGRLPGRVRDSAVFSPDGQWLIVTEVKETQVYRITPPGTPS